VFECRVIVAAQERSFHRLHDALSFAANFEEDVDQTA
jgi:hypothetical protein